MSEGKELAKQATQKNSKFNFKSLFKDLKWDTKTSPEKPEKK